MGFLFSSNTIRKQPLNECGFGFFLTHFQLKKKEDGSDSKKSIFRIRMAEAHTNKKIK